MLAGESSCEGDAQADLDLGGFALGSPAFYPHQLT